MNLDIFKQIFLQSQLIIKIMDSLSHTEAIESGGPREKQGIIQRLIKKGPKSRKSKKVKNQPTVIFSQEEDQLILRLVLHLGPQFKKISLHFPDKGMTHVKNRYYKNLRYRWEDVLGSQYKCFSLSKLPIIEISEVKQKLDELNLFSKIRATFSPIMSMLQDLESTLLQIQN
ncbi:hypothetical protein pb186bvf_005778 [Paramecium bursaria]